VTLPLKILCFHLASAKEEYSLFTTSAWKSGLNRKDSVKKQWHSLPTTGKTLSVRYAKLHTHIYLRLATTSTI
jgi:hypothetical protein